ncbi:MAG: signal recognition particle protein, partial [Solirubrobacterales bacterium]
HKLLNGSRRLRIARGSGTTVTEVNSLIQRFEQAAKMMKTVAKGGTPQIPGMGPMPGGFGGGGGKKAVKKKKGGSRSGNPAKRAAENTARSEGAALGGGVAAGSGFGLGAGAGGAGGPAGKGEPSEEELAALQKFLGR